MDPQIDLFESTDVETNDDRSIQFSRVDTGLLKDSNNSTMNGREIEALGIKAQVGFNILNRLLFWHFTLSVLMLVKKCVKHALGIIKKSTNTPRPIKSLVLNILTKRTNGYFSKLNLLSE